MQQKIIEKTIYGKKIQVIKDNIKVEKDFQIPLIEDRAFKYICKVYPKVIIKFLAGICNINEDLIESAYFMDTAMPDLRFNDKKMTVDLLVNISSDEYINIEANTSKGKSVQIKNINYMFRFILSKQKMSEALKSIKSTQVNFDLYSEKFMGGINNVFSSRNSLNNKILPEMPVVIHIGLDKIYENPYNENIDNWNMRFLKMLTSRSISYTEELAGDFEDLKEVSRLMKEYSEDTSNLIYYDKEAMEESMRITDLKFAKEEGLDEGFNLGEKNGILIGEKRGEKNGKLKRSIEIAKNLLEKGISIDIISESTNIPKKEILKLQNN